MGRLWLEVRALGRTDPPLPEAHWTAPLPLPALPARFFTLRSPGPAHEASSLSPAPTLGPFLGIGDGTRADPHRVVFPSDGPSPGFAAPQIHPKIKDWPIDRLGEPPTQAPTRPQQQSYTDTARQRPPNKWTQLDTQTFRTERQTLRELDPQTSLQEALGSGSGCGVRLPKDPGPRRGLHTLTNEALHSGWICCEWLWVLYQCPSQIKVQRWPDFVGFGCWKMGGSLLSGVSLGAIHTFTPSCKLQRPLLALEALPPLPVTPPD